MIKINMLSISLITNCILVFINVVSAYTQFSNYTSTLQTNDIAFNNSYAWVATKGGLIRIEPATGEIQLNSATEHFPDLNLTALCFDTRGNLWIGTKRGLLYTISVKGRHTVSTAYSSSGWDITDMFLYKKYLIISSSKGCSVYDTENNRVVQNAVSFGTFNMSTVNTINVYRDRLFLGCTEGVASLDVSGDNIVTKNFIDRNIWSVEKTDSAIVSLPVYKDSLLYMRVVSGVWNNSLFHAHDTLMTLSGLWWGVIYKDTTRWKRFISKVRTIVSDNSGNCWFGTESDSIYRWDGIKVHGYNANALTYRLVSRVCIAGNGTVWFTPKVTYYDAPDSVYYLRTVWYQGVASYDGTIWRLFRQGLPKDFGDPGDSDFLGIAEDNYGNMWFGNNGGGIKRYNIVKNRWDGYQIGSNFPTPFKFVPGNQGLRWSKCDAIAKDSSGYMWFACFLNDSGSVLCFNSKYDIPADTNYKFCFPSGSPYHFNWPTQLNVDALGYIFLGSSSINGGDNGRLIVFNYTGNPLSGTINKPIVDVSYKNIFHMASTQDTVTWIVTGDGLYHYQFHGTQGPILTPVKDAPANLTCVAVESSTRYSNIPLTREDEYETIESVLWFGTLNDGIVRVVARQMMNSSGVINVIKVDSISYLKESDGLINNIVNYMAIDRKNGYLWVATDEGVSRYFIGNTFKKLTSNVDVVAYPNPYSISKHSQIVFKNLSPNSKISVYTVDGRAVEHIVDKGGNVLKTGNAWTFFWNPAKKLLPGVYFYIAKKDQEFETSKKRGVVGKILVIP